MCIAHAAHAHVHVHVHVHVRVHDHVHDHQPLHVAPPYLEMHPRILRCEANLEMVILHLKMPGILRCPGPSWDAGHPEMGRSHLKMPEILRCKPPILGCESS